MTNFTIEFVYPWLLLLIIPALALALIPHFLTKKKYRRTRNRITSLVFHCIIMTLAVLVLAGMTFEYDVPNDENEILLVVDSSYSTRETRTAKDGFVKSVIDYSDSRYKVGVVTFGYDQDYSAPLSYNGEETYAKYIDAMNGAKVNDTATDIEAALSYARSLLKYPETSKIVLVTDGVETDGKAASVIRGIAADGVRVDTKHFAQAAAPEVMPIAVAYPDYNIVVNDEFALTLTLRSSTEGDGTVVMYDNNVLIETKQVAVMQGTQNIAFNHTFTSEGLHVLKFVVTAGNDELAENNEYVSYVYIETFNKLLVVETEEGESENLVALLNENEFEVTVVDVHDSAAMPKTVNDLCAFDQVILMNVSPRDFPQADAASGAEGFEAILDYYVREIGGGLFTVGGSRTDEYTGNQIANGYNRDDLDEAKTYSGLLPVQAINYTPPLGLVIVIDRSGSMNGKDDSGMTRIDAARQGALACVDVMSDRDYCGIISFGSDYQVEVDMTPKPQEWLIKQAIDQIEIDGGTVFTGPIVEAGRLLGQLEGVDRRHIIFITDGVPGDSKEKYLEAIKANREKDITMTVVGIGVGEVGSAANTLEEIADAAAGRYYRVTEYETLRDKLREELSLPEISAYEPVEFSPRITAHTAAVAGLTQQDFSGVMTEDGSYSVPPVTLGGYYGTKLKDEATQVLMGDYVPVYAQWQCGAGTVGSFLSDLKGTPDSWSQNFISSEPGKKFIINAIRALFPINTVRPTDITLELKEQNYRTQMNIYTRLGENEQIETEMFIASEDGASETLVRSMRMGVSDGYSRITLTTFDPGVYRIHVKKLDASGNVISEAQTYKAFSYSAEYDVFLDSQQAKVSLDELAEHGNGMVVEDESDVFVGFVDVLHRVVDPRLAMMIIALILFLLDIAVRKFKFKWPHELIRAAKEKKSK